MAGLALVLVGDGIGDRLARRRHQIHPPARQRQRRFGLFGIPAIGQRHPALGAVEQHAGLDQAALGALAKSKGLDDRRAHGEFQQPLAVGSQLRAFGQVDEAQLLRPVRPQRRAQRIGRHAKRRHLRLGMDEEAVFLERPRKTIALYRCIGHGRRDDPRLGDHAAEREQRQRKQAQPRPHFSRASSAAGAPTSGKL